MRATLAQYLNSKQDNDTYLLHADMFPFRVHNEINPGVQEYLLVNMAAGLAQQGKTVYIYGVCGFVLHKTYDQIRLSLKRDNGTVIFVNAGANGCYDHIGKGHTINDDRELCKLLDIKLYEPRSGATFLKRIKSLEKEVGVHFVRLGWDETDRHEVLK